MKVLKVNLFIYLLLAIPVTYSLSDEFQEKVNETDFVLKHYCSSQLPNKCLTVFNGNFSFTRAQNICQSFDGVQINLQNQSTLDIISSILSENDDIHNLVLNAKRATYIKSVIDLKGRFKQQEGNGNALVLKSSVFNWYPSLENWDSNYKALCEYKNCSGRHVCYLVSTFSYNWFEARRFCLSIEADLMTDVEKAKAVKFPKPTSEYWLGTSRFYWAWVISGKKISRLPQTPEWSEPYYEDHSTECASIRISKCGHESCWKWQAHQCDTPTDLSVVCKFNESYFLYGSAKKIKQGRCSEVTIRNEVYGSIHFGEGEVNETKSSISKCLESAQAKATGMCLYNSTGVFYWKILEFHCTTENRTTFSEVKKELSDLKDKITKNFEGTVEKALKVVKDKLENMSADDVNTVTRFVEEASNVYKTISEKRAESLIKIMGVAMEAPALAPNKITVKHDKDVVKTQISLINTLESVVSKMDLNAASYNKTFNKFRVEVYEQMEIENRNFTFNPLASESDDTEKAKGQIEVIIPKEAFESAQNQKIGKLRANFIIYNSTELFENPSQSEAEKTANEKIVSSIISGSIAGANITGLQKKINLTFQVANVTESLKCVFADLSNDSWRWSEAGMETQKENDKGKILCQSDHLTNFAVLAGYKDDKYSTALTYISIIGMVLSIICLSFLIFTQMFFKKFRKGQYQIALLNLAVSLIIVNLLILLGLDRIENKVVCGIVAALLHYFLLVSFAWMLIEAILQYYKFVKVFNVHVSSFVWKTGLPAWTLPALVVIMTAAIDHKQYSASKTHCWLAKEAFHYAFLLPLAFVVAANTFIFIRIIKGISCDRPKGMQTNQTKSRLVWLQVQAGICCFIVMGLTWCFALFAFGKAAIVMQFLFAIFNSMQGCFVFILFCLREKPVRKAWYALLCQGKASKKLISSTDSQSSSSLGKFKRRIKKEDNELSGSDFSGTKNTESTDAALSKI